MNCINEASDFNGGYRCMPLPHIPENAMRRETKTAAPGLALFENDGQHDERKILSDTPRMGRSSTSTLKRFVTRTAIGIATVVLSLAGNYASAASGNTLTAYPGGTWEPGPAKYGSTVIDNVPVTMDDGTVLRASIAYPTNLATGQRVDGRFPVVIEHTPYVRLANPINPITYFAEHGYITVVVRARGTGASGGDTQQFAPREGLDGKAIVDWAAHRLDGSDGRVALIGCSFPGGIALTDAAAVGPNSPVKAVIAACIGLNVVQRETWLVGGLPTTGFSYFTSFGPYLMGNAPAAISFYGKVANEIETGGDAAYDRTYWHDRLPLRLARNIFDNGIPVLLWGGWGDILETGALRAYAAFQNAYAKRPIELPMDHHQRTTPRYQLIIGNWQHAQGLDMGVYLEWLETWVKGIDTGISKTRTPLHLFESGTNRWINSARYPTVSSYTPWYFDSSGALTHTPALSSGNDTLIWGNPAYPGTSLTYTTQPIAEGATLAGPLSATIFASSSNTNLELIAKLFDIAPDGTATEISRGAVLGSQRTLNERWSWMDEKGTVIWPWPALQRDDYLTPGKVYRLDISLAPRQYGINPNHRLRLELTTQTPTTLCPASGTPPFNGTEPCRLTSPQQATLPGGVYNVLHGAQWPSTINLPLLPWKILPAVAGGSTPTAWDESTRSYVTNGFTLPLDWGKPREGEHGDDEN
ncbi:CocE/NonD family hydrolase [Burkholderia pyrrocinia]|uniref:CocE/NonD family hydrolase n=1 Tax=Burkholderia pyrrocinia TaxID=60550 RepID=UPI002AB14520|nr:CocE/NonD family hydrolase [Burkholderia pyrrocinia]